MARFLLWSEFAIADPRGAGDKLEECGLSCPLRVPF